MKNLVVEKKQTSTTIGSQNYYYRGDSRIANNFYADLILSALRANSFESRIQPSIHRTGVREQRYVQSTISNGLTSSKKLTIKLSAEQHRVFRDVILDEAEIVSRGRYVEL